MRALLRLLLAALLAFGGPARAQVVTFSGAQAINGPTTIGVTTKIAGIATFNRVNTSANLGHATGVVTIGNLIYADSTVIAGSTGAVVTAYQEMGIYGSATPGAGAHWVANKPYIHNEHTGTIGTFTASQPTVATAVGSTTTGDVYGTVSYFSYNGGTVARYLAHSGGNASSVNGPGTITDWVDYHSPALTVTGGGTITNQYAFLNESSAKNISTAGPIRSYGTNISMRLAPTGTGAFIAAVPDNAATGGNARGANAVDLQTTRSAATQVASGAQATIVGGINNTASGQNSVAGGATNQAIGAQSVAFGNSNIANTTSSVAFGQQTNTYGLFGAGFGYLGFDNGRYGTLFISSGYGSAARIGLPQTSVAVLRNRTTNASTVTLTADQAAAGASNVLNMQTTSAMVHRGVVIAQSGGTAMKAWDVICAGRKGANNAATNLNLNSVTALSGGDAGLSTATVACVVDTTNGAILVQGTGIAATTIDWSYHPIIGEIGS